MPSPILARADALMQRRLHGQATSDDIPVLTDAISNDGIPLLLDAETPPVPPTAAATGQPPSSEAAAALAPENTARPPATTASAPADDGIDEILVNELARRIERRLQAELPKIIAATVSELLAEQSISSDGEQPG